MKLAENASRRATMLRTLALTLLGLLLAAALGGITTALLPPDWPAGRAAFGAALAALAGTGWVWGFLVRPLDGVPPGACAHADGILRHAVDGILTMDARGLIHSFNPAAERLFGYTAAEVVGQPMSRLLVDTLGDTRGSSGRDMLSPGTVLGLAAGARELFGQRKDGGTFPLELALSDMPCGDERLRVALTRDVSKRKEAQRQLAAHYAATRLLAADGPREETLPRILDVLCGGLGWDAAEYWAVDREASVLRGEARHGTQPEAEEFVRESASWTFGPGLDLPGQVWARRGPVWVSNLTADLDCPRRALAGRAGVRGACGFPVALGEEVLGVLCFYTRRVLKADEPLGKMLLALASQLGQYLQHKHAELQLVRREHELADLFANAAVGIDLVAPDGTILRANRAELELLGYAVEEYVGRNLREFHADRAVAEDLLARLAAGETVQNQEARLRAKDGSIRHVLLDCNGLWENDRLLRARRYTRDFTAHRKLQEQFQQGLKMEAIGRLAGGVAHDFNNLLTVITGYSETLLMALPPDDPARESITEIRKAGTRAASLTSQLLAFSRKQVLVPAVLDVNKLVGDMETLLRRLIGEDVDFALALGPGPNRVKADPGQLEQVLMNLVVNARAAMPTGGHLTLQTAAVELDESYARLHPYVVPGRYVLLSVSDTGCGMDDYTKAHLFEPFFTTREKGKGTGLGLATVYGIVKQSGGHIEVYSEPGRGTTFKIYLPSSAAPLAASSSSLGIGPMACGSETILLVEDEDGLRALARRILGSLGYRILEANGGPQALEVHEHFTDKIDLLLTDVVMPRMSGRQLANLVQAARPGLKVLYMSGYTDDAIVRHGVLEQSMAFLPKPFTPKALAAKVRELLDETGGPQAPAMAGAGAPKVWEDEDPSGGKLCVTSR